MPIIIIILSVTSLTTSSSLHEFPSGEYLPADGKVTLRESIDVSVYGTPLNIEIGRASFVEADDSQHWRLVLVNTDNITVLSEGAAPETIEYSFPANRCYYSPDNTYIVLTASRGTVPNAMRVNTDTGEKEVFNCADGRGIGSLLVSNKGSVAVLHGGGISFYDEDLNHCNTVTSYRGGGSMIFDMVDDGSVVMYGYGWTLYGFTGEGEQIWEQADLPVAVQLQRTAADSDNLKFAVFDAHKIFVINAVNGQLLETIDNNNDFMETIMFCPDGSLFYGTFSWTESERFIRIHNYKNNDNIIGVIVYSIAYGPMRTMSPMSFSDNGIMLYSVEHFPDDRILILADLDGTVLWSERSRRDANTYTIGGTDFRIPFTSFGELSDDGTAMCTCIDGRFVVYGIGAD